MSMAAIAVVVPSSTVSAASFRRPTPFIRADVVIGRDSHSFGRDTRIPMSVSPQQLRFHHPGNRPASRVRALEAHSSSGNESDEAWRFASRDEAGYELAEKREVADDHRVIIRLDQK